jgi:arsenite methyltransferase
MTGAEPPLGTQSPIDKWADWVFKRRFGGNQTLFRATMEQLGEVADRVLARAEIQQGNIVLDVGTGDGLLGSRAIERVGESGTVIFSDISGDVIDQCRSIFAGVTAPMIACVTTPIEALELPSESVDRIVARAVVMYSHNRQRAFDEFFRVLKPNGLFSICEPINQFSGSVAAEKLFMGFDLTPLGVIGERVAQAMRAEKVGDVNTIINFTERDLFRHAVNAGFKEIRMDLEAYRTNRLRYPDWDAWMDSAPNPHSPTPREAMLRALSKEEQEQFVQYVRPLVESINTTKYFAQAYLSASR